MAKASQPIMTPVGDLNWVFITGDGKKDPNGNDIYSVEIQFDKDSDEFASVKSEIDSFWEEKKPKGGKMKSNGIRVAKEKQGDAYVETDKMALTFKTHIKFPDGKAKVVKTFNAKGKEVDMTNIKIGNGSKGRINGVMGIYDNGPAARGVALYLNSMQISKLVEYNDGGSFGEVDGDFETATEDSFPEI